MAVARMGTEERREGRGEKGRGEEAGWGEEGRGGKRREERGEEAGWGEEGGKGRG